MKKSVHSIFKNRIGLFLIIASLISSALIAGVSYAAIPPVPTYGHATVDGVLSSGEWDLTNDFFADMYRAGDPEKALESKAYLKYDSNKHIMYVLVLTVPGIPALSTGWEGAAWAAIDSTNNKVYTGSVGNDGVPPDFAWVGLAYDGNSGHALGYEASFTLDPGVYTLIVHIEVYDGDPGGGNEKAQTSATVGFPKNGVLLDVTQIQQPHPGIQVVKFISVDGGTTWIDTSASPGATSVEHGTDVKFKFEVTNTGDVDLSDVVVTDSWFTTFSWTIPVLAVGQTLSLILDQTISATAGETHQNTATVTGWYKGQMYSDTDDASYVGVNTEVPSLRMTKFVSVDGGLNWDDANVSPGPMVAYGDPIYYKFLVENDGTVALSPISIDDPPLDFSGVEFPDSLGSGETFVCILGPFEAGLNQQTNTATASGTYGGTDYTYSDSANYFGTHPEINVDKYVSVDGGDTWISADDLPGPYVLTGQTVKLKFTVSNLGNVPIDQIVLKDTPNIDFGIYPSSLLVGEYFDVIVDVVVFEGQQTDVVTVAGKYGNTPVGDSDEAHYFGASPSIRVVKYVSDDGVTWFDSNTSPGIYILTSNAVYFKFVVTNTGNVPLTDITLTDDPAMTFDGDIPAILTPGESFTVTSTTTASEGQQTDTATATGYYAGMPYWNSDVANYYGASPAIQMQKYVSVDNGVTWFDANELGVGPYVLTGSTSVVFKFVVTNIGNVALDSVTFTDVPNGNYGTYPTLAPGASFEVIWGPKTAIEGQQTDTATAHGHFNKIEYSASDDGNYFGASPAIKVIKYVSVDGGTTWIDANTATGPIAKKDSTVYFKFVVTNTGNVLLTDITLTDSAMTIPIASIPPSLAPGASFTYTSGAITAAFGQHTNTATATGYNGSLLYTATSSDTANYYGTLVTYTIGGYAGTGVPGQILSAQWNNISPLEIGYYTATPGFGYLWERNALGLANLKKFLTTTGSPSAITKDVLNPTTTSKTGGGTLACQTAGLTINIRLSGLGTGMPAGFGNLVYINPGDSLSGYTVNQILVAANKALAGQGLPVGYNNYANVNNIVSNLNLAFDNGVPTSWAINYLKAPP